MEQERFSGQSTSASYAIKIHFNGKKYIKIWKRSSICMCVCFFLQPFQCDLRVP